MNAEEREKVKAALHWLSAAPRGPGNKRRAVLILAELLNDKEENDEIRGQE